MRAVLFLILFFLAPSVFAFQVPSDGSAGSLPPPEEQTGTQAQEPSAEVKPEVAEEVVPAAELATSSVTAPVEPRPKPSSAPASAPAVGVAPQASVPAPQEDSETTTSSAESSGSSVSPWVWLSGLLALASGGIYGAYSLMKAMQTKGGQSKNACDALQSSLNQKQYELSLAEHEFSFHEEALRILEEKAIEKAEKEKNKVISKIEGTAKDALLGKKGESDARTVFDTAEKAKDTYEDIQKKIEKTKELLEMLGSKRDGISSEASALEVSCAACVAQLPDAAKALAVEGLKIPIPGNRPVRAIIFDWAGVMATEAYWIWVRKNIIDITPLMSIDMKLDVGEMPHEEFVALLAKLSHKTPTEVWAEVKSEMILNEELIALIPELKKKYKIALLSNYTAPWLREILEENKLWELFDEHIISSEHKLVKPDSKIFKKMLTMLDVGAGEAVFTDDRKINVDAAQRLGIRAFLYTGVEQFKKDLKSAGVSV